MGYRDSYVYGLRQKVGHTCLLVPFGAVLALDPSGAVLLARRVDNGEWSLPGGLAEPGETFAVAARRELAEETGIEVALEDLVPFAAASDPAVHEVRFPNGDVVQGFGLYFLTRAWRGLPVPDGDEMSEVAFHAHPPAPLNAVAAQGLELLAAHLATGAFQLG